MWIKSGMAKSPCHVIQKVARAVPPLRCGGRSLSGGPPLPALCVRRGKAVGRLRRGPSPRPGCPAVRAAAARSFALPRPLRRAPVCVLLVVCVRVRAPRPPARAI